MGRIKMDRVCRMIGDGLGGMGECAGPVPYTTCAIGRRGRRRKRKLAVVCYLGNEDEAEGASGAKDDKDRYDDVGNVLLVLQDERNSSANHAHDHHVVHTHTC
jgi:hypothetical protein